MGYISISQTMSALQRKPTGTIYVSVGSFCTPRKRVPILSTKNLFHEFPLQNRRGTLIKKIGQNEMRLPYSNSSKRLTYLL